MALFASKTPHDLNHDPEPYWTPGGNSSDRRWPVQSDLGLRQYRPRAEFDHVQHNEPNPILVALRQGVREDGSPLAEVAGDYIAALDIYARHGDKAGRVERGEWLDSDPFDVVTCWPLERLDVSRIDHARRVLSRLASLEARA